MSIYLLLEPVVHLSRVKVSFCSVVYWNDKSIVQVWYELHIEKTAKPIRVEPYNTFPADIFGKYKISLTASTGW